EFLEPLTPIGANKIAYAHYVSPADHGMLLRDAEEVAITSAMFIREVYSNPEGLYADIPELRSIVTSSFFHRPEAVKARANSPFPDVLFVAPDYFESEGKDRYR